MSAYHSYGTEMKEASVLAEALRLESNFKAKVSETPRQLEGYEGDKRKQTAEVIVPREQVGHASNDIGFKRDSEGNFRAVISEFDRGRFNGEWLTRVEQRYTEVKVMNEWRARGYSEFERETVKTDKGVRVVIRAKTPAPQVAQVQQQVTRL
jgi:hypothetical protein